MPEMEIGRQIDRLMRRIHASLNAKAAEFDHHKIGPVGGMLLLTLAEIEPARMQDLARQMARDKSQMTRIVQALERKGLVERRDDPTDARASLLALTQSGRETIDVLQRAVGAALTDILTPLSPEEKNALGEMLKKI